MVSLIVKTNKLKWKYIFNPYKRFNIFLLLDLFLYELFVKKYKLQIKEIEYSNCEDIEVLQNLSTQAEKNNTE